MEGYFFVKKIIFLISIIPNLLSAQFLNFSGSVGLSKGWEQSIATRDFIETFNFRKRKSSVLGLNYGVRCEFKLSSKNFILNVNRGEVGNSFGFNFDNTMLNSFPKIRTRHYIGSTYIQTSVLVNAYHNNQLFESANHNIKLDLNLGLSINKVNNPKKVNESAGEVYSNQGREDTLVLAYDYDFLDKTGVGLMGEIIINRVKKESGIPSTLFFKIVIHQGLTKLAQGRVDVALNSVTDNFSFISRGSYAGVALGFYIARNKVSYQKQHEFYGKLKFGS